MQTFRRSAALGGMFALAMALTACGSSTSTPTGSGAGYGDCKVTSKANSITLTPVQPGTLTVQTSLPAVGWFNGTKAENISSGFEYCMSADIANMAGLKSVTVKNVSFAQMVAGHTDNFDLALNTISITPDRAKVVDFSTPYFDSALGVLAKKGGGVAENNIVTKKCGVQSGTTAVEFVQNTVKCDAKFYPDQQTLYQGLRSGQVDAVLLDTAIVLAQAKDSGGELEVIGQYSTGDHYAAILPKGSANKDALNRAIQTMTEDHTLDQLSKDYLGPAFGGDPNSVPVWTAR